MLESPVLTPAFNNVIPALFGALACQYFSKSLRLTVLPLAVMCVVFVALPSLIGSVSFLILLGGGLSIAWGWWLSKKGKLGGKLG